MEDGGDSRLRQVSGNAGHGRSLLQERSEFRPSFCSVVEPTLMQLVSGRKGAVGHRCSVAGLEADVNLSPTGVDAIYDAARLIAFIADLGDELANGHYDDGFDIWHSILSIGMVEGGTAFNVVAGACEFTLDLKNAPQVDRHAISARIIDFATTTLLPGMVDVYPRANIRFERMLARPGCELPADDPLIGQLGGDDWLQ